MVLPLLLTGNKSVDVAPNNAVYRDGISKHQLEEFSNSLSTSSFR